MKQNKTDSRINEALNLIDERIASIKANIVYIRDIDDHGYNIYYQEGEIAFLQELKGVLG